jgi:hypothetical protein
MACPRVMACLSPRQGLIQVEPENMEALAKSIRKK